jgi:Domain of unknown function (DUF929)
MAKGKRAHRPVTAGRTSAAKPATPTSARPAGRGASTAPTDSTSSKAGVPPARSAGQATAGASTAKSTSATSASQGRSRGGAGNPRRRALQVPWWRRGKTPIYGTVTIVVVLIALFVYISNNQAPNIGAQPASPSVVTAVTHVSPQVFSAVGTGGVTNQLKSISGASLLKGPNGKPEVVYIGAGYCPYCAAQRWSMIVALSRFGTFKNLQMTHSSTTDVYPNTPTFTFYGSTYTSQYIDFVPVEETGQDQSTILQTPTVQQQNLLNTYDTSQYVGNQANGIPFIDYGNRFISVSSAYSPQVLTAQSWQDIANALSDSTSTTTQNVVGTANYMTAAICTLTNNQPASVCAAAPIPQIEQQVQKGQ